MISFNTVIENFNRVYKDRNSSEKHLFLNSSLELIEDSSQKASFFDIVDALQSHKWEPTSETDTSEVSKKIKKLWLQAKFIYDNEPFSIRGKSRLINLFDKSITEGTFLNPTKLEEYRQQIQSYCEILYICKLIVQAEEKLVHLSESIGFPTNLKKYYESLELKYEKVLAFQDTPEFHFLKNIKYTNPLLYLSIFIEGDEGQIKKAHPELLEFFELAECTPAHSKKKKSAKKSFTPEQIRNRLVTILKNSPYKEARKTNNKQLLPFSYSIPTDPKLKLEEYYNLIKDIAKSHTEVIKILEKNLQRLEKISEGSSKQDRLLPEIVTIAASTLETLKGDIFKKDNALPILALLPLIKTQSFYTQGLKKYIEVFRKVYTPLKNKSSVTTSTLVTTESSTYKIKGTKGAFLKNRSEKLGQDFMRFVTIETDIFKEHFPTLFDQPDYLSTKETTSQVKKEVVEVGSTYSILIKELSKIALASTSVQKETQEISPEYRKLLDLLVSDSTSLPSPEEFISLNLKHPVDDFFSEKEIETLGQLITHFEGFRQKIINEKMRAYCEEYIQLKSRPSSLKKPLIRSEESFVSQVQVEEETSCIEKQSDLKISTPSSPEESCFVKLPESLKDQESTFIDDEEEATSSIAEQQDVNIPEEPILSTTALSSTGAIPKRLSQKTDTYLNKSKIVKDDIRELYSLRQLQSVRMETKLPKFHYHDRIKRWAFDSKTALSNPAYKNLTKTKFNKKETIAFHSFPKIIDGLLGTNYCQEEGYKEGKGTSYNIPAIIIMQDIQYEGYFEYTVNDKQTCYHRCFNPERRSAAHNALNEDFSSDQYFSHEKLNIQCDPDTQTIKIDDPSHEMEIYIFSPSTNN